MARPSGAPPGRTPGHSPRVATSSEGHAEPGVGLAVMADRHRFYLPAANAAFGTLASDMLRSSASAEISRA